MPMSRSARPSRTQTLFRIGSVSKLFTWTAVMQQVEAGKLDLDTDVNQYIDFKIPEGFGKPITLRNLMTHTPGFEDVVKELFVATPKDVEPLPRYLATHVPARIFPPGEVPAYSNYGTTLAGYIVERAAGMPLERYLHERILDPLGMKSTSFAQPLPGALEAFMSKGYKNGTDPLVPFEVVQAWPAGSVSASAEDMSRFIRAFLGAGRLGDAQILKPETVAAMHTRTFGASPALNGMALGFYEETRNGHRIVGHAGDTQAFHTDLHVVPDLNLGFFVSYNSSGRAQVSGRSELWEAILDRYYPEPLPAASAQTLAAKTLAGNYLISRRADSNFLKALFGISQLTVVPQPDGTLVVDGLNRNDGAPRRWRAEGPTTFRAQDGKDRIAFERDAAGGVTLAVDFPFMVFKRVPWYLDKRFIQGLAGFSIGMLLLTSLGWPLAAMTRKHYGRTLGLEPGERRLRLWSRLVGILWLLLLAGWTVFIVKGLSDIGTLSRRTDWLILTLEALTILLCLLSLVPVLNALRAWQARAMVLDPAPRNSGGARLPRPRMACHLGAPREADDPLLEGDQALHVAAGQPLAAVQERQLDEEEARVYDTARCFHEFHGGGGGAAGGDDVVHHQHRVAAFQRVAVHVHRVGAVFERVARREGECGQLARLAHRHEAGADALRHHRTKDEAAALHRHHLVDGAPGAQLDQLVGAEAQQRTVAQQRRHVLEDDAGLWKIGDVADRRLEGRNRLFAAQAAQEVHRTSKRRSPRSGAAAASTLATRAKAGPLRSSSS